MSTRGLFGFKKNGVLKCHYNHFDSYFEGLGKSLLQTIAKIPKEERLGKFNAIYDNLVVVDEDTPPTKEDLEYCQLFYKFDEKYGDGSWDNLLNRAQGDLELYLKGFKFMLDAEDFLQDGLFCEYAYIINLDNETFDIYKGGNNLVLQVNLKGSRFNYKNIQERVENEE